MVCREDLVLQVKKAKEDILAREVFLETLWRVHQDHQVLLDQLVKREEMVCLAILVFLGQKEAKDHLGVFAPFVPLEVRVPKVHLEKTVLMAPQETEVLLVVEVFKGNEEMMANQVYLDLLELLDNLVDQDCLE